MSMIRAALALAGAALFVSAAADAQTVSSSVSPCAGETTLTFETPADRGSQGSAADWTQEQVNAQPQGEETRDREAYKRQVTALYQQHLGVYTGQAQKFANDKQLLEQFKTGFQGAKLAVAQEANQEIAKGVEPVDRNNGVATLTNPERQLRSSSTPVELGNRDLATLTTDVAADRAAMTQSCEMLVEDRQILNRISNAH